MIGAALIAVSKRIEIGVSGAESLAFGSSRVVPRLLRVREAACYLGMSTKAIRQLIMSGELPYVQRKPGNSPFLIDRRDLDRWTETHKVCLQS